MLYLLRPQYIGNIITPAVACSESPPKQGLIVPAISFGRTEGDIE